MEAGPWSLGVKIEAYMAKKTHGDEEGWVCGENPSVACSACPLPGGRRLAAIAS